MLVSFASDLWLHWRYSAEHLANLFVDFEPGIHTPGANAVRHYGYYLRIYNPVKQSMDQDPEGEFIHAGCPGAGDNKDSRPMGGNAHGAIGSRL